MHYNDFENLILRRRITTTICVICLSVILAALIVWLNAQAAVCRSENAVTFYPAADQSGKADGLDTASCWCPNLK